MSFVSPAQIVQRSADHRIDAASMRGQRTVDTWLHEGAGDPALLQPLRDIAVAAADIEKQPIWREAPHQAHDTFISMSEPKGFVLHGEAGRVA